MSTVQEYARKEKLRKALAYLGKKWVFHKDYKPCSRHSTNLDTWKTARTLQPA